MNFQEVGSLPETDLEADGWEEIKVLHQAESRSMYYGKHGVGGCVGEGG